MFVLDVLTAARTVRRAHVFPIRIILPIALGIALSSVAFVAFDCLVLRAVPYPKPHELVLISSDSASWGLFKGGLSIPDLKDIQLQASSFAAVGAARADSGMDLSTPGWFQQVSDALVCGDFFKVIGLKPVLGRWLLPEDNDPAKSSVVVLSYGLWQEMFGSDATVLGRTVLLDNKPFTVVGVMPSAFRFPSANVQVWIPQPYTSSVISDRLLRDQPVIARLKPSVSVRRAQAELQAVAIRIARTFPESNAGWEFRVRSLEEDTVGPVKPAAEILLAATLMILLIACANIGNLLVIRNISRRQEIAIKLTLGASRLQLFRQLLYESVILALVGGLLGVAFSIWGLRLLRAIAPSTLPQLHEAAVDPALIGYGFLLALLTGAVFGTVPALYATRVDLSQSLRDGFSPLKTFSGFHGHHLRAIFVCVQVALAVVLAMASGWMLHSLVRLTAVSVGFQPRNLRAVELSRMPDRSKKVLFFRSVLGNVSSLPGVDSAALVSLTPFRGDSMLMMVSPESQSGRRRITPFVEFRTVSPGYFGTMQIPLMQGRNFKDGDRPDSPCVIIVNRSLSHAFWPEERALDKRIELGGAGLDNPYYCVVVGVVGDSRDIALESPPTPEIYFLDTQRPALSYSLVIRTDRSGPAFAAAVRERVLSLRKSEELTDVKNVEDAVETALAGPRLRTEVAGLFAIASLFLAIAGVYGVTAYSASLRRQEIGVRIAMGAQGADILKSMLRDSMIVTITGITLGVGSALAVGRILGSLLFEIRSTDSASLIFIPMIVLAGSVLASYIPARQAARLDASTLLRHQ